MSTSVNDESTTTTSSSSPLPPFYTDTPLPLIPTTHSTSGGATDPFTTEASNMALSHNVLIRGFNSIYQTAPRLFPSATTNSSSSPLPASKDAAAAKGRQGEEDDERDGSTGVETTGVETIGGLTGAELERARADFVAYCLAWARLVDEHHRVEEEGIFPEVERIVGEEGVMGREEEEHVAIHNGISSLRTYLLTLPPPTSNSLSAITLLSHLDSFSAPLHAHLASEPLTLCALSRFSAAFAAADTTLVDVSLAHGKKAMASADFVLNVLPCFLLNMEFEEFEDGYWRGRWPALGGVGRWVLWNVVPLWRKGWWRFASCDEGGRRRRLVV